MYVTLPVYYTLSIMHPYTGHNRIKPNFFLNSVKTDVRNLHASHVYQFVILYCVSIHPEHVVVICIRVVLRIHVVLRYATHPAAGYELLYDGLSNYLIKYAGVGHTFFVGSVTYYNNSF